MVIASSQYFTLGEIGDGCSFITIEGCGFLTILGMWEIADMAVVIVSLQSLALRKIADKDDHSCG